MTTSDTTVLSQTAATKGGVKARVVRFNPRRFHVQNHFNRESALAVNKQAKTFINATTILSKKTKVLGEVKKNGRDGTHARAHTHLYVCVQ